MSFGLLPRLLRVLNWVDLGWASVYTYDLRCLIVWLRCMCMLDYFCIFFDFYNRAGNHDFEIVGLLSFLLVLMRRLHIGPRLVIVMAACFNEQSFLAM